MTTSDSRGRGKRSLHGSDVEVRLSCRSRLFESWITLSSGNIAIQWISVNKTNHAIPWLVIYPVGCVIHLLNNLGLRFTAFTHKSCILTDDILLRVAPSSHWGAKNYVTIGFCATSRRWQNKSKRKEDLGLPFKKQAWWAAAHLLRWAENTWNQVVRPDKPLLFYCEHRSSFELERLRKRHNNVALLA